MLNKLRCYIFFKMMSILDLYIVVKDPSNQYESLDIALYIKAGDREEEMEEEK